MACVGKMYITVYMNTKNLSRGLRLLAIPAKMYLGVVNLIYKLTGKKTHKLTVNIGEENA
jgi:hypothetical protein